MTIELPPPNVAITDKLVTVPWYNFFKEVSDSSLFYNSADFGAVGNGTADDTNALQGLLDAVSETGGVAYIQPGTYYITSALQFTPGADVSCTLYGQGAWITPNTSLADYCLYINRLAPTSGKGNVSQTIIDGLNFDQQSSSTLLGSIINKGKNRVSFRNVRSIVQSAVNSQFAGITITEDGGGTQFALWNEVKTCAFRGNSVNMPIGVWVRGISNATLIENCFFNTMDLCVVSEYTNALTGAVANSLRVDGNYFENATYGVKIKALNIAGAAFNGGRITNNRFENITTAISFGELYKSAGVGRKPFVGCNEQTAVTTFVSNPNSVEWYDLSTATLRTDTAVSTNF